MRVAVLSDIHGNLEALEAVLADFSGREVETVLCLGDMIGYGPNPEEVIREVRMRRCLAVLGNHEAALASPAARRWMNFQAQENNVRTKQLLSGESLAYCCGLPRSLELAGAWFVHGYPPDSVFAYLFNQTDQKIAELFALSSVALYFVGHTHDLQLVQEIDGEIVRSPLAQGRIRLQAEKKYLLNAGSVGQPRDGENSAKYLIWDATAGEIETRYIPYDFKTTVEKIHALGFPDAYAERLCRS